MNAATARPAPVRPALARALAVRRETPDIFTLTLENPGGPDRWEPGQFNMLGAPGWGEVPISFSGDPAEQDRLVHTVRVAGNATAALCRLRPGQFATVRGPFGSGWPVERAAGRSLVLVAGGLGLPPLRPVIYRALADPARFPALTLLYGAKQPLDLVYKRELDRWARRAGLRVELTVDRAASLRWTGKVGLVTNLIKQAAFEPGQTLAFVCGPEIMMSYAIGGLLARGVRPGDIYLSLERNMKCGYGLCGHCQWGPYFICQDGPVFAYDRARDWFERREV